MSSKKKKQQKKQNFFSVKLRGILAGICLALAVSGAVAYAEGETGTSAGQLLNGSFEIGKENIDFSRKYAQPSKVSSWNTTAKEGKFELFIENTGTYISQNKVILKPTDEEVAAELNADEASTLYQTVTTKSSSIYEWGLDHGARTSKDVMALVIGPAQDVKPSKTAKAGQDQFMQMIDSLTESEKNVSPGEEPKHYIIYSKKFGADGTFLDNAGNNAFSRTASTIYTEEWQIWIMADTQQADENNENIWTSYGSNAEGSAGNKTESGGTDIDLSKYYLYTVPSGQTQTLFAFVSVSSERRNSQGEKDTTYGNFLDKINFQLYHPLSGSSTAHGSGVVGGSDGTTEGEGTADNKGHEVTVDNSLITYVTDGEALKIQAIVKADDAGAGCEFVGVYYTVQDAEGNPLTKFLQLAGNEIKDTGSLTDNEKERKWIKSTNEAGDTVYTYYLDNITSATDLHFVFIKSPTITYDANGGIPYVVNRTYNTNEADNVYSFKPAMLTENSSEEVDGVSGATPTDKKELFISPYVSKAAVGQSDGWKFMGWLLTGDTVDNIPAGIGQVNADQLGSLILPAEHTVACNYSVAGAAGQTAAQYFKIYNGNVTLTKNIQKSDSNEIQGVQWTDNGETKAYANVHKGLTMVAQWRWRQAFIPQVSRANIYMNSIDGGTIEITSVTDKSNANYNSAYNADGGKSYHAQTDETITVTATAKEGFTFEGWYDVSGNLVTTNTTYSYTETKEGVNTYYARFSNNVTQTYIRQVKNGDTWVDTEDDAVGTLGRYTYTDAAGTPISSTATAGTGYKFVGWYDSTGSKVADSMLINNGATISYTTTGDATYYARFETAYTVKFVAQTKQANGSFNTDTVGGKVSVASVTDVNGAAVSSKATANSGYKFLGWYDKNGNQLSTSATYSTTTTSATNGVTYYARFEILYTPTVKKLYLSFIAESEKTNIPSAFNGRDAGTGINGVRYGLDNKFGNTIATGFEYAIDTVSMADVKTIQITVNVPASAYVKVGGTGNFTGNGTSILTDSDGVAHNKGSIQQISGETTLTYYWDASGLQANTQYGFIIDNLYAPGATATITVNGTDGTEVTNDNGVVNTASGAYRENSHYPK